MSHNKKSDKRIKSTKEYIDALSKKHSKIAIVRVDLGYKKPYSDSVTLDEANNDFNRMMNNRRSKPSVFKEQVGYLCKREYTQDKGVHLHVVIIYDGQKIQKDAFKANQIGNYWEELTEDKGSYHRCNPNDYKHNGIGILDHRDKDKRKILDEHVIPYLCKEEQDIQPLKGSKKDRVFTRGTIKKDEKKKGRPRS
ncbi:MAG: inovirus Gp2 family protein [Bacteroidia bacterium]|nr:inovirus Gp2 family protein [Bacteroidia bacterium]